MAGRGPEPEQRGVSERVTAGFKARRNHGWGQNGPGGNPRGTGLDNDTPPALIIVAGADGGVNFIDGPVVRAERKGSRPRSNRPDSTIAAPDMRTIFRGTDEIERFRQIYSQPIKFKKENWKAESILRAATEVTVYENVEVAPERQGVDWYKKLQELERIVAEAYAGAREHPRRVLITVATAGLIAACVPPEGLAKNPIVSPIQTGAAASEKAAQTTVAVVYNRVVGDPQKTLEAASGVLFGAKTPAASGSEPKPIGPQAKGTPQTPARNEATSTPKPIVESTPISQVVIEIKPSQWSEVVKAIQNDDNWSGFEGVAQILGPNLIVVAPKRSDIYGSSILLVIGDDGKVRDARDISNFASATPTKYLVTHTFMSDLGKNGSHLDNPILITVSYYLPDRKSQKLAELIKEREVDENFMRLSGPDGKPFIVYVDNTGKIIAAWDVKNEKMQFPGDKDFQLAEKQPVIIASIDPKALGDLQENDSVITQVRNSNGEVEYYLGPAPAPAAIIEVPKPTATPTEAPKPPATAPATPVSSFEDLNGGPQNVQVSIDRLVRIDPNPSRTIQQGGNLAIFDNSADIVYQQIVKKYGYADNNVLVATATGNEKNRRAQTFIFNSLPDSVLKPPYSLIFPFKLGDTLDNIGSGGWLNLLTTFRAGTNFEIIANVDVLPNQTINLNIKNADGSTYKFIRGGRLNKGWNVGEFREDQDGLVYMIVHVPILDENNKITGWQDIEEASSITKNADIAQQNHQPFVEAGLAAGHAVSMYAVNVAEGSKVMRGPVIVKQLKK